MTQEHLQQVETKKPGSLGEPVGRHFVKSQLAFDLSEAQEPQLASGDEVDVDLEDPDSGLRAD